MLMQCGGTINCPAEIQDTSLCGDRKVASTLTHGFCYLMQHFSIYTLVGPVVMLPYEQLLKQKVCILHLKHLQVRAQVLKSASMVQYRGCATATSTCKRVNGYFWQCQVFSLSAGHPVSSHGLPPLPPLGALHPA